MILAFNKCLVRKQSLDILKGTKIFLNKTNASTLKNKTQLHLAKLKQKLKKNYLMVE